MQHTTCMDGLEIGARYPDDEPPRFYSALEVPIRISRVGERAKYELHMPLTATLAVGSSSVV
jgi:hypothetical protein